MATISEPEFQARGPASRDAAGDRFELITRALNVAYYEWVPGREELHGSPVLLDLFGCAAGTWTQQRALATIHDDDRPGFRAARIAYLKGKADRAEFTYRARMASGEWRWLRDQTAVERDDGGRVTRLVGAVSDITEAKQREALNRDLIARQAASVEVLKAISASPDDPQTVFRLIALRAAELCNAVAVVVCEYDGTLVHMRVVEGYDQALSDRLMLAFPRRPGPETIAGRVVLGGRNAHVRDVSADAELYPLANDLGVGTLLGVPLHRESNPIGVIIVARSEPGGFDDSQVALIESFAEQAVIAIVSTVTLRELHERTAELTARNTQYGERIEQQSATIDVLKAMSASPGDAQRVFELIAERARTFCDADKVAIALLDGESLRLQAHTALNDAFDRDYEAQFPRPLDASSVFGRAILAREAVQSPDMHTDPRHLSAQIRALDIRAIVGVPIIRAGAPIGAIAIARKEPGEFSAIQMELLQTFAEQAVIAIGSAETYRELQARTAALAQRNSEYGERIEHQSATIDVLKAMSASPGNVQPVFDLIARQAAKLCNVPTAAVATFDGTMVHLATQNGFDAAYADAYVSQFPRPVGLDFSMGRAILSQRVDQVEDIAADPGHSFVGVLGHWSVMAVPMLRDGVPLGAITIGRPAVGPFSGSQVALLQTFAEQAVIAITSAETYRELQERTEALAQRNSEFGERIEQQTATIDVLKAMSASPDDAQPVFDLITLRAQQLCNSRGAYLFEYDGGLIHVRSTTAFGGVDPVFDSGFAATFPIAPTRGSIPGRAILDRRVVHVRDMDADPDLLPIVRDLVVRDAGVQSVLAIPLLRDGVAIGAFGMNSNHAGGFSDSQVALLQTFAEQAVIAISSAETFRALRHRTAELTRSVSELQALEEVLRAVNSSLERETVLATIISRAVQLSQSDEGTIYEYDATDQVFVPRAAFGMSDERVAQLRELRIRLGETHLGRSALLRAPVAVDDVQQDPSVPHAAETLPGIHAVLAVPLLREDAVIGGLVIRRHTGDRFAPNLVTLMQTFAGQAVLAIENARLFQEAGRARTAAEAALADLRRTQDRLVQSEKMASLGQLTAGIAHEIKNPLNFVNNFSDLSRDLLDELNAAVAPDRLAAAADLRAEIDELTATLKSNLEKIAQHGRRADSIVKNMLVHSRSGPSECRAIDLNATVEEALNLAYHGARAETPGFNMTLKKAFDPAVGMVDLYPQEFVRVIVNLINNGFYAALTRASRPAESGFEPTLWVTTRGLDGQVEIRVRDNGTGISEAVRDKIFEPFFTTKPAGEGTGLGLSLSYDIVVNQHGGQLAVDSQIDAFTEFVITLPRAMTANKEDRP